MSKPFEIFAVTVPGMEATLQAEAKEKGFKHAAVVPGGVTFMGHWTSVWRANLHLRGATRILARIGQFRAYHLAELERRAAEFPWDDVLSRGEPVSVEVTSRNSKIYHQRAAAERIEKAISAKLACQINKDAIVSIRVRIENNICTLSVDTSGEPLHKRGAKAFVGKAPLRETLAALFLRQCEYDGTEPVFDPMCGSGTFILEAAEMASGLAPGRNREFAFMKLASFQPNRWESMLADLTSTSTALTFVGADRDTGAIKGAQSNAQRAGVEHCCDFLHQSISDATPPNGPTGVVMVNPPYGDRIGNKRQLYGLYGALGQQLKSQFKGWRVGLVTTDTGLAKATGLHFRPHGAPIPHGGLRITLFQTDPLP